MKSPAALLDDELLRPVSRGLLKPLILVLLAKEELHGYRLMERLKALVGRRMGPGFIYPALKELEGKGYIKGRWLNGGGRRVKKYCLTDAGRVLCRRFKEYLQSLLDEL